MTKQAPDSIVMVRPASFGFNPETAGTNAFQNSVMTGENIAQKALEEFDAMVEILRSNAIDVIVISDTTTPVKPDALYPNNWVSFHPDGKVILYPMMAENRRFERNNPVLETVQAKFEVRQVLDYSSHEKNGKFLEGTGSMVFDYVNRIAYACRSARTDAEVLEEVCLALGFRPILFDAVDESGLPIYHTNVIMCIGTHFSVICLDAVKRESDQDVILNLMAQTRHQVISISYAQMHAFAGNMLEVCSVTGQAFVLLSERAFNSLLPGQANALARHANLLPLPIPSIEIYGGGSVRCMIAGVFNQKL
jgi:hypothetical protein